MTKMKEDQPHNGEVILLCPHTGIQKRFHWFRTTEMSEFTRPDGSKGNTRWMAICEDCFGKFETPMEAITQDQVWQGDKPIIKENVQ